MKIVAAKSQNEDGALAFDFYEIDSTKFGEVAKTGGDFVIIEAWRDEDALTAHNKSEHFQTFFKAFVEPGKVRISLQVLDDVLKVRSRST